MAFSGVWPPASFVQYDKDEAQAGIIAWPQGSAGTSYTCVANVGRIARVVPSRAMTITNVGFVVTTAAGADDACDVAIYSASLARLASAGATAGKLNSTGAKTVTLTASVTLQPGVVYYAGFSNGALGGTAAVLGAVGYSAGTTSNIFGSSAPQVQFATMNSAHPLPDPFVVANGGSCPMLALRES